MGRALFLDCRVSWVRVPPRAAHFFCWKSVILGVVALHLCCLSPHYDSCTVHTPDPFIKVAKHSSRSKPHPTSTFLHSPKPGSALNKTLYASKYFATHRHHLGVQVIKTRELYTVGKHVPDQSITMHLASPSYSEYHCG